MLITLKSVSLHTRSMCIDQVNLITNNCKLVNKNLTSCLIYFHSFQCNKLHWISQPKPQQLWSFSMQAIRNWTEGTSKQDTVDWKDSQAHKCTQKHTHTHTHTSNSPFSGLPGWAGTRKVTPIWILLKQETVSGSGISWAICKSASRSRQTSAPHHSVFYRPDALPAAQPTASKHWRLCTQQI